MIDEICTISVSDKLLSVLRQTERLQVLRQHCLCIQIV